MFRIIRLLFKGKNLKTSLFVFGTLITLAIGVAGYTVHLKSTVENLRETNDLVQQSNRELRTQMDENQLRFQREVSALNKSFEHYQGLLRSLQMRNEYLQRGFDEIQDEAVIQCLNTELPSDIVDRLYKHP